MKNWDIDKKCAAFISGADILKLYYCCFAKTNRAGDKPALFLYSPTDKKRKKVQHI